MYTDFLKWDPQNPAQPTKFSILDNLSWTHKDYDVEYRFVNGKSYLLSISTVLETGLWTSQSSPWMKPMSLDWPHESPDNQYHLNK